MDIIQQKACLRQALRQSRENLSREEVTKYSQLIVARLIKIAPFENTKSLHTYLPIVNKKEVSTYPLLEHIWQNFSSIKVFVPILGGEQFNSASIGPKTKFRKIKFDISEPSKLQTSKNNQLYDIIIVPMLGFDRQGHRLGYGKGYYDHFLAEQHGAVKIGLAYSFSEVKEGLPHEAHDIAMDSVITQSEIIFSPASKLQT
jgi:5-formyltetrahydrofolate cyclo-ligase